MKVRDVIRRLEEGGWQIETQEGSHRTFKKQGERNIVTVSGRDGQDITLGQLSDVRRKSGLPLR